MHLGWFRPVHCKSVSAREVRAVLGARKAIQQGMIALEMSLRGLLRNFGLKVGSISRGRFEQRMRELSAGNSMLEAATEPMLRARRPASGTGWAGGCDSWPGTTQHAPG